LCPWIEPQCNVMDLLVIQSRKNKCLSMTRTVTQWKKVDLFKRGESHQM
jgi:hypothetical protein